MRRVTYKSVFDRVAGLLQGISSASADGVLGLDRTDAAVARQFILQGVREFWERYAWPDVMATERRLYRPQWSSVTAYAAETEVWYWPTRKYYQALQASINQTPALLSGGVYTVNGAYWAEASEDVVSGEGQGASDWSASTAYAVGGAAISPVDGEVYQAHTTNTNQQPPNASYWGRRTDFVRSLALAQAGQTEISAVRRIWSIDPRAHDARQVSGYELRFETYSDEVVVRANCTDTGIIWVEFWPVTPTYDGADWDSAAIYAAGTVMYFTDGDFWECQATTSAGESPLTAAAKWTRLDFPQVLAEMVAWRVFGEMDPLHGEGAAGNGMGMAEQIFGDEVIKLERTQGQTRQLNVLTR